MNIGHSLNLSRNTHLERPSHYPWNNRPTNLSETEECKTRETEAAQARSWTSRRSIIKISLSSHLNARMPGLPSWPPLFVHTPKERQTQREREREREKKMKRVFYETPMIRRNVPRESVVSYEKLRSSQGDSAVNFLLLRRATERRGA